MKTVLQVARECAEASRAIEAFESSDLSKLSSRELRRVRLALLKREDELIDRLRNWWERITVQKQLEVYRELGDDAFVCDGL